MGILLATTKGVFIKPGAWARDSGLIGENDLKITSEVFLGEFAGDLAVFSWFRFVLPSLFYRF